MNLRVLRRQYDIYLGGISDPPTVEFVKVYRGADHKNEQIIISLLVGGGYPQHLPFYIYSGWNGWWLAFSFVIYENRKTNDCPPKINSWKMYFMQKQS